MVVDLIDRWRNGPRPQPPANGPGMAPAPQLVPERPAGARAPAASTAPPQPGWTPPGVHWFHSRGALRQADAAATPAAANSCRLMQRRREMPVRHPPLRRRVRRPRKMATDAAAKAGATPETADAIADIVGGVLDEVARRRAERRAAEAANPEQAPPRRGRLLQRRPLPPQPQQTPPAVPPLTPPSAGTAPQQ